MHINIFLPESQVATVEFGMNNKGFRYIFCTLATAGIAILYLKPKVGTVYLTSIDHPQIGGKFTATPSGLTNLVYGCID